MLNFFCHAHAMLLSTTGILAFRMNLDTLMPSCSNSSFQPPGFEVCMPSFLGESLVRWHKTPAVWSCISDGYSLASALI